MIALIQRVSQARVLVAGVPEDGATIGAIGQGLLVFVCAERGDSQREANALLAKVLALRIFSDAAGKMNLNVREAGGGLLIVPQFTLAADTSGGNRPSFSRAAPPDVGRGLFDRFVAAASAMHQPVAAGAFGATMQVELLNDGPVTLWLEVSPKEGI